MIKLQKIHEDKEIIKLQNERIQLQKQTLEEEQMNLNDKRQIQMEEKEEIEQLGKEIDDVKLRIMKERNVV